MSEADRGEGERECGRDEATHHGDDGRDAILRKTVEGSAHDVTVERSRLGGRGLAQPEAVCYGFGSSRSPAGVLAVSTIASSHARSMAGRSPA